MKYYRTAERPEIKLWLEDDDGELIDLATGFTFSFKVGRPGAAALLTKTAGITGASGAGSEPDGTPNCTIAFTAGELVTAQVTAGNYVAQLTATSSSLDRVWQWSFKVEDVVT